MSKRFFCPILIYKAVRVVLLSKCNYDCGFCHNDGVPKRSKHTFAFENLCKILDCFHELNVESISFSGGEPLIYPEIVKILSYSIKLFGSNNVYFTTNGSLLEEKIPSLKKAGLRKIHVSIPTISQGVYKKIMTNGDLNKVLKGLRKALKSNFDVEINVLLLRGINSSQKELKKIFDFWNGMVSKLNLLRVYPLNKEGRFRKIKTSTIRKRLKDLGLSGEIIPDGSLLATKYTYKNLEVALRDFLPEKNIEPCTSCYFSNLCEEGLYRPRLTPDGKLKYCLLRPDLDLLIVNNHQIDKKEIKIKLEKFFRVYRSMSDYWVRAD